MKIRSIDKDIKDILESGFYRIPRFQRPYSWDRENIEDFWNDVIINADADYFIGGDLPRLFQPVITEDFKIAANSFGVR